MKQLYITLLSILLFTAAFSQANTKLSNLISPTAVNQHLLPNTTNARDLGTSSYSWRNLYLRGYVYLDGVRFLSNHPGTGAHNTFVGSYTANALTSGTNNAALGHAALYKITSGYANTAIGAYALYNNTTSFSNTAVGTRTLYNNTTGMRNTAIGDSALFSNVNGFENTAIGYLALYSHTTQYFNNAVGTHALYHNTSTYNNALGAYALYSNTTGGFNTAMGEEALYSNTTGDYNTAFGSYALGKVTTGLWNTAIGYGADVITGNIYNATALGDEAIVDASNKVRIGNINVTSIGGQVNWTAFSDGRYKQNIKEDVHGLDFINALRPITYTVDVKGLNGYYNKNRRESSQDVSASMQAERTTAETEASKIVYNGFVAQEVERAAQKLNYAFSGIDKPQNSQGLYGLRYSDFVVPLVKAVQELSEKDKQIDVLQRHVANQQQQIDELRQMVLELKGGTGTITSNAAYLEQNTPNPVSSITTIRYHIPEAVTSARLDITNAKGQLVKTISISNKGAGQLNLNSAVLASGTYNYTLYVDGKPVDTKRLVIVR